jgi:hypothetical protein
MPLWGEEYILYRESVKTLFLRVMIKPPKIQQTFKYVENIWLREVEFHLPSLAQDGVLQSEVIVPAEDIELVIVIAQFIP